MAIVAPQEGEPIEITESLRIALYTVGLSPALIKLYQKASKEDNGCMEILFSKQLSAYAFEILSRVPGYTVKILTAKTRVMVNDHIFCIQKTKDP